MMLYVGAAVVGLLGVLLWWWWSRQSEDDSYGSTKAASYITTAPKPNANGTGANGSLPKDSSTKVPSGDAGIALRSPSPPGSPKPGRAAVSNSPLTRAVIRTSTPGRSSSPFSARRRADSTPDVGEPLLRILYGSQTGTAEGFAYTLRDEAKAAGIGTAVVDLEKYKPEEKFPSEKLLLMFVVATYGEGEPTDNAKDFYKWLMNPERKRGVAAGIRYCVFGLGNKTYEKFNAVAKIIDRRMEELGATRVIPRGEGDDDANLEDDFRSWRKRLWPEIKRLLLPSSAGATSPATGAAATTAAAAAAAGTSSPTTAAAAGTTASAAASGAGGSAATATAAAAATVEEEEPVHRRRFALKRHLDLRSDSTPLLLARFTPRETRRAVALASSDGSPSSSPSSSSSSSFANLVAVPDNLTTVTAAAAAAPVDAKNPFLATILENRELHGAASERSCRHVELSLDVERHPTLSYVPGDHLGIFSSNAHETVESLLRRLGANGDEVVSLVPMESGGGEGFGPVTIRTAFLFFLDITNPPRPSVLRALAPHAAVREESTALLRLGSHIGQEDYQRTIKQHMVTLLELLEKFPSLQPPLDLVFELLPRLAPRYYSISSSPRHTPARVSITVAVLTFRTGTGRLHRGVCSSWMRDMIPGQTVPIFVRRSAFRLPPTLRTPVVMVGPGTGLAPFRGFVLDRAALAPSSRTASTAAVSSSTTSSTSSVVSAVSSTATLISPAALQAPTTASSPSNALLLSGVAAAVLESSESVVVSGATVLFFGCRNREHDYIYREELEALVREGRLQLFTAFSREQTEKVYVQHRIREQAALLVPLLVRDGAFVYVCGDARQMPDDVRKALVAVLVQGGGGVAALSQAEAEALLAKMHSEGRYQQDVWF